MKIDLQELIWGFSILYLVLHLFQGLKKVINRCMALTLNSPPPPSSNISSLSPNLSWVGEFLVGSCGGSPGPLANYSDHDDQHNQSGDHESLMSQVIYNIDNIDNKQREEEEDDKKRRRFYHQNAGRAHEKVMKENECTDIDDHKYYPLQEKSVVLESEGSGSLGIMTEVGDCGARGGITKLRKRPARLVLPEYFAGQEFCENGRSRKFEKQEFEVEGRDFFLAAKKGRREAMEDGYGVLLDIMGDPKQVSNILL